ncbi:MAG: HIT family protein [Bacteriovoracaceae bacterium]|nr:HIT family protein [Bacteriovoracaceae bacterium]
MDDCIFCKILRGEIEATFVHKGEKASAIMDLFPLNQGHVLVIPNDHSQWFSDIDPETVGEMFKLGQRVLKAIKKSDIKSDAANLFLSDGKIAGQEVMHSHLHIAPRFKEDGYRMGFSGGSPSERTREKLTETAEIIKQNLL